MKTELQERADGLASNLQRSINVCFEVLQSISQLFASSEGVERQDFQRFVQPVLSRHPSIQALEWVPRLLEGDRPAFEQAIQQEGFADFQITEQNAEGKIIRAALRPEYFPVHYAEPLAGNQLALGFDVASDRIRRTALEKARDAGQIVLSRRIELIQEAPKQHGLLVILPIYQQGIVGSTLQSRRNQLQGFVLGVFRVNDVIQAALSGLNLDHIDFYLCDKSDSLEQGMLATYHSQTRRVIMDPDIGKGIFPLHLDSEATRTPSKEICTRHFPVADRQWMLLLAPTSAYIDRAELYQQSQIRADAATAEAEKLKLVLRNLQDTQARWFLEKRLIASGVGLILVILAVANLASYRNITRLAQSQQEIASSYQVINGLTRIRAVTMARNWDGSLPRSETENSLLPLLAADLDTLRTVLSPDQHATLDQLEDWLTQSIKPHSPDSKEPDHQAALLAQAQTMQQLMGEIEQRSRAHLAQWEAQANDSIRATLFTNLVGIVLSVALLISVYYLLQRQINERQQVEAALFEANNQLEIEVQQRDAELAETREISDLKMRLFSMVSHEFRTPLSTILVSTQALANGDRLSLDERTTKNLSRIQTAAKTMAQLLTDILTLNRAEAGKLEFRPESLDLVAFCRHLIDELQPNAPQTIHFTVQGGPSEALVDSKLLHSILTNLLSNAIKYSPPETSIACILTRTPAAVTFQVQDQGIGIPPDDQMRLYETFHRGNNVGDIIGTGLGLAVVKTCVELHGGQVDVESQVGQGTTFTVTLPQ